MFLLGCMASGLAALLVGAATNNHLLAMATAATLIAIAAFIENAADIVVKGMRR